MNTPNTNTTADSLSELDGPSAADLAAIEVEAPLIALEGELLDAEIELVEALAAVERRGEPSELEVRRVRRAQRVVLARTLVCRITAESLISGAVLDGAA